MAAGEYDDTLATNEGVMASDWKDTVTSHLAETNSIEGNIGITSAGPVSKSAEDTEFQHQDERQWSELKNESDDAVLIASPVPVSFVRMEKAPSPPTSSPLSNLSPHTPLADVSSSSLEVTEVKNLVSSPPPLPPVIFPKSASYVHWSDAVLLTEEESKDEESTEEEIGLLQRAGVLNVAPPHPLHFSKPASAATSTTAMHSHQQGNTFSKGASAALRVSGPRRSAFMKETAVSSLKAKVREQKTAQQRKGMQTPSNESNVKRSMVKRPASPKAAQEVFADGNLTTDSSTVPLKRTFRSPSPSRMPSRLNKTKGAIIYSPERLSQSQQIFAKSSLKEKHCERLSKNDALEAREALLDLAIRDALVGVARSKDLPRERDVVPHVERGTDTDDAHDFLELESLKAQLFELQQSINGPLREGTDVVKLEFSPECDKKEMSSGPVTLTQKEYNKMQRDIKSLETLVNGFQRENERMYRNKILLYDRCMIIFKKYCLKGFRA